MPKELYVVSSNYHRLPCLLVTDDLALANVKLFELANETFSNYKVQNSGNVATIFHDSFEGGVRAAFILHFIILNDTYNIEEVTRLEKQSP